MRLGRLAEAWIAPPAVREVRELVRYRAKLVQLRSGLKAQVHAVMAKEGVLPTMTDMFCQAGQRELDRMALGDVYVVRVESLRDIFRVESNALRRIFRVRRLDTMHARRRDALAITMQMNRHLRRLPSVD